MAIYRLQLGHVLLLRIAALDNHYYTRELLKTCCEAAKKPRNGVSADIGEWYFWACFSEHTQATQAEEYFDGGTPITLSLRICSHQASGMCALGLRYLYDKKVHGSGGFSRPRSNP